MRADVEEVQAAIDAGTQAMAAESVAVADAVGRVLTSDVRSPVSVPAFPRAAMDGWALRGEDTFGASGTDPLALRVVGRAMPGAPFDGTVERGEDRL